MAQKQKGVAGAVIKARHLNIEAVNGHNTSQV
jgi:hypothetical protein